MTARRTSSAPRGAGRFGADGFPWRVALVLGKHPRPGTIVARVAERLRREGLAVELHLPHEGTQGPHGLAAALRGADLIVQRGLGPDALAALAPLEAAGVRCCNPVAATAALADRLATCRRLAAAGLAVPDTRPAETWPAARALATGRPSVVKARGGARGRGMGVLMVAGGAPPARAPFPGPYIVQTFVPGDGRDRKLYLAGSRARGLLKRGAGVAPRGAPAEPSRPSRAHAALAAAAGAALGLDVYGVDLIAGADRAWVVDVNAFPGFRGVGGAGALIARHILALMDAAPGGRPPGQPGSITTTGISRAVLPW